jgi:hypothetical protein
MNVSECFQRALTIEKKTHPEVGRTIPIGWGALMEGGGRLLT